MLGAQWLLARMGRKSNLRNGNECDPPVKGLSLGALTESTGPTQRCRAGMPGFLQNACCRARQFFSLLVSWGEVMVGLGVLPGALTGIAAGLAS
jgi:hypothetical protein